MKTLILLLSIMMITGIATAKRSGDGSENHKSFESGECDGSGEEHQERKRNRYKEHKGDCDGSGEGEVKERKRNRHKKHKGDGDGHHRKKPTQEQIEKRIRRMSKGDEAEYNRLIQLRKDDPQAFKKEMRARRAKRNKNRDSKPRDSKNRRGE